MRVKNEVSVIWRFHQFLIILSNLLISWGVKKKFLQFPFPTLISRILKLGECFMVAQSQLFHSIGGSKKDCSPLSQHKICNMHPCGTTGGLKGPTFRDEQCAQNNNVPHEVCKMSIIYFICRKIHLTNTRN